MNKIIECPFCKKDNNYELISELDDKYLSDILKCQIFKKSCSYCNREFNIEYPISFISDNYIVSYKRMITHKIDKKVLRICNDYDDFKEKILIFNDSLNDILIEFIKDYIMGEVNDSSLILRYDSMNENQIIFYDLKNEKNMAISRELYDKLLEHSKIKKIRSMCEINGDNYIKYIKVV